MPHISEHPSDWTLELLAEGALPPESEARVAQHVAACARCAAEVEAYRSLFAAMASLPRFEPSPSFDDAVLARVRIAPQRAAAAAWLARWLPSTSRGWLVLLGLALAPALPLIALVAWLLSRPMVTAAGLWQVGSTWAREAAWSLVVRAAAQAVESGVAEWGGSVLERLRATPPEVLTVGTLILAVGIPLSVWTLYRTLRTPTGGTTYAH